MISRWSFVKLKEQIRQRSSSSLRPSDVPIFRHRNSNCSLHSVPNSIRLSGHDSTRRSVVGGRKHVPLRTNTYCASTLKQMPFERTSFSLFLRSLASSIPTPDNDKEDRIRNSGMSSIPSIRGRFVVSQSGGRIQVKVVLHKGDTRSFSQTTSGTDAKDKNRQETNVASQSAGDSTTETTISSGASGERSMDENQSRANRRRRRRVTVLYPNDQDVIQQHAKRKELSRDRMFKNVYRALLGNLVIASSKFMAWTVSQSSSMMSEFIHSVVDCANQYLLLQGLRDSSNVADRRHPYGYGKSVYFWALVSALGTFFMGFGVSMSHAWGELMNPSLHVIGPEVLGVLGFSFLVDGYVVFKTVSEIRSELKPGETFWSHIRTMRDPITLAILLEDGAACFGVLIAIAGTSCSHLTGMPIFDGLAGVSISLLLGSMGFILARVNHSFLLGQAVDKEITDGIERILKSRRSIEAVHSVQSQWTGPDTFSYKAEVGFDGTFLAAKLMPTHEKEFFAIRDTMKTELPLVLSWYAEDVIRAVEREVRIIEGLVRKKYPEAEFIELEPMSKDFDQYAIDGIFEENLRRIESENLAALGQIIQSLDQHDAATDEGSSNSPQQEKP